MEYSRKGIVSHGMQRMSLQHWEYLHALHPIPCAWLPLLTLLQVDLVIDLTSSGNYYTEEEWRVHGVRCVKVGYLYICRHPQLMGSFAPHPTCTLALHSLRTLAPDPTWLSSYLPLICSTPLPPPHLPFTLSLPSCRPLSYRSLSTACHGRAPSSEL